MDDHLDYKPTADGVWPPKPTLLPPKTPKPFHVRHPFWALILIGGGLWLLSLGVFCVQELIVSAYHMLNVSKVVHFGLGSLFGLMALLFWIRFKIFKQEREKNAVAALEAEALAAQNATD